jgi:hypothetical protein
MVDIRELVRPEEGAKRANRKWWFKPIMHARAVEQYHNSFWSITE